MLRFLWFGLCVVIVALFVGFAFLLGLSFGLGESHGKFVLEAVPVLSMLGGWISGLGALAAVITTLWLANKQRREDVEHLKVSVNMALVNPDQPWFISVQAVADGKRPSTLRSLTFTSPRARHALHVTGFMNFGSSLPVQLSYGEKAEFQLDYGAEDLLRGFVEKHCQGDAKGLKAVISTNLNSFSTGVHKNFLTLNS